MPGTRCALTAALTQDSQLLQDSLTTRADPARLYAPVILDSVYGYEAINVESQERYPFSLLLMFLVSGLMYFAFQRRGWLS